MTSQSIDTTKISQMASDVQTTKRNAPAEKRRVIDNVFTQLGFDKLFLDGPHGSNRAPKLPATDFESPLVLHVDDDVDLVNAVTSRFKATGYRVASALDGISGIQEALRHPADVIVLDFDMPNGRGDAVIDLLKSNEKTQDIPIVVLTAVHQKGLKRRLLNQGADKFMTKPFEFFELQETVQSLIESR